VVSTGKEQLQLETAEEQNEKTN